MNFRVNRSLLLLLLLAGSVFAAFASPGSELWDLTESKRFFDLRDRVAAPGSGRDKDILFYRAVVENKFNRPEHSTALLEKYLRGPGKNANTPIKRRVYTLLADNYVKTFQYRKAAAAYDLILAKHAAGLDEGEAASYRNVAKLWAALAHVPAQRIINTSPSEIQGKQELVGLTIPVEVNGRPDNFIFDTGANLSTITESQALRLGLTLIETDVDIGSITGGDIKAKLGVAKQMGIGNAKLENVVFIVFPDKALYIEQIKYQIHGILGFPAIEALREVTWTRGKQIIIPAKPSSAKLSNLALDGLTPLIHGSYGGKMLTFAFDTGARTTSLYPPFFKSFETAITAAGKPYMETITGAGGSRKVNAYKLENVAMEFGGKSSLFKTVEVLTEKTTDSSGFFYGNIGRDVIDQHERMTINFHSMAITFQ